jgi:hypothetical protein
VSAKVSKRALTLLTLEFSRDGHKASYSATHTSQGTWPLWGQLVLAGYVEQIPSVLGHTFNYRITKDGERALEAGL